MENPLSIMCHKYKKVYNNNLYRAIRIIRQQLAVIFFLGGRGGDVQELEAFLV
jgi:hypothetical protein